MAPLAKFGRKDLFLVKNLAKKLSISSRLKYYNPNIFANRWCKPLIFQTEIILPDKTHCLKYLRSTTLGCKDIATKSLSLW